MIKLQEHFTSGAGGFAAEPLTYDVVTRNEKHAVYQRSKDGKVRDFEVFIVKMLPKGTIQKFPNGVIKTIEDDTELYATASGWGKIAWTCMSKDRAMERFNELSSVKIEDDSVDIEIEDTTVPVVKTGHRGRQPKERHDLVIPADIEFSTKQLAELNKVEYQDAVFFINQALGRQIKFAGEKRFAARGKMSKMYSKI